MLRIRALDITVESEGGEFGVRIDDLPVGLTVFRANNSAGKSTLVQSIIFALGMEGMLSASHKVPLPHAMTSEIEADGQKYRVKRSWVELEIENSKGEVACVRRYAQGGDRPNLIHLFKGAYLTASDQELSEGIESEELYARLAGAAQNKKGFHYWLKNFIGWELPIVPKYNEGESPLYLECIFPLMIVEQKKAWTGIQARMPTHLQIRDVSKRSIEFILGLDVFKKLVDRQRLQEEQTGLLKGWNSKNDEITALAREVHAVPHGLLDKPSDDFEGFRLMISRDKSWIGLSQEMEVLESELRKLDSRPVPTVEQLSEEVESELDALTDKLIEIDFVQSDLLSELQFARGNITALEVRIAALKEDERENKDAKKIRALKQSQDLSITQSGKCPTCSQAIDDTLLPLDAKSQPMTIDETITFIEDQLKLFNATLSTERRTLAAKETQLKKLQASGAEYRTRIRTLKDALVAASSSPSVSDVEARIRLRDKIKLLRRTIERVEEENEQITQIGADYLDRTQKLKKMGKDLLSAKDMAKVGDLEKLFQKHAQQFGVTSLPPKSITISTNTYQPEYEGFNLEFELSASDNIRTIWAYLHSLLELSRKVESTNHLGLLILDEPRQQETKRPSFREFFKRASSAKEANQQVFVATSEETEILDSLLEGIDHHRIEIETEKVLTRRKKKESEG